MSASTRGGEEGSVADRVARAARRCALAAALATAPAMVPNAQPVDGESRAPREPLAVVVHPATTVTGMSLAELRRVFLGEQQFWTGGSRVVLFVQAPGTSERSVMLRRVYRMDETEFKRYWIAKTFRNDVAFGPKIVSTSALARRLTAQIPGGVSVIPLSAVDSTVRVVRVDGRLPADDGYPLTRGGGGTEE